MTRPPRPKYPSDAKDYHELRRPGCAHTVRLPEDLLPTYAQLKRSLGRNTSHADVIRFLFEAADPAIQAAIQRTNVQVVIDSQEETVADFPPSMDPNDDIVEDAPDSEESDHEMLDEAGDLRADLDHGPVPDSQVQQSARVYPDPTNAFWSHSKVRDFFRMFRVVCPVDGCARQFLPPNIKTFMHVWSLGMKCPVGHSFSFLTGELERNHGTPDITGRLYHSSLCSGMTHSCLESMCLELGLHVPRKVHFFEFQSGRKRNTGWISAALDLWQEQKDNLQQDLLRKGQPLVVYVDCRFDSSRSGYHGTVPVINIDDDKVIEMVTLTRKETGSSWRIETAALERALAIFEEKGIRIAEVVHDDNQLMCMKPVVHDDSQLSSGPLI
ncbi:hypothetical protein R1sor_025625 [Riccia sorocarpa]|uniref:Transposase n=1 Tax=Riccia sorocarpa TaxID=122646 RepID=A0ABD3G953_9MARC